MRTSDDGPVTHNHHVTRQSTVNSGRCEVTAMTEHSTTYVLNVPRSYRKIREKRKSIDLFVKAQQSRFHCIHIYTHGMLEVHAKRELQ